MDSTQRKNFLPWIIGGCSLLVVLACVFSLVAGGLLVANRAVKGVKTAVKLTPQTAALVDVQGFVEVKGTSGLWTTARPDMTLEAGSNVRAGKLSSACLLFNDGSRATLKAESELRIDELDAGGKGKPRAIAMTQVSGESTHQVIPNKRNGSRYEVLTPSGAALAKGTEFSVIVTPAQAAYIYVLDGVVAVSGVETTVMVNPGFMTIIIPQLPPMQPVQTVSAEGIVSQVGPEWTVAGTTFTADEDTIVVGEPQVGDWAMIKGHLNDSGKNIADWVVLLRSDPANRFSLTGTVETIEADRWTVNGTTITITETTELDDDIVVGDIVHVEGIIETGTQFKATRIERIDAEAGMPFAITGVIEAVDGDAWTISGVEMQTDDDSTVTDGLKAGDLVRAEGRILPDGTWLAEEIILVSEDGSEFAFTGTLESKDPWKAAGISFEVRADTALPSDLEIGDLVRVEGTVDADGTWIATRIERIDPESGGTLVLIGTVISLDPLVIGGIPVFLAPGVELPDDITVGMLVRVELVMQENGAWLVVKIEPLTALVWFPGCMDLIATVVSVDGSQITLQNWPVMTLAEGATVEGTLAPGSVIRMRVCFNDDMTIIIVYIVIIVDGDVVEEPPQSDEGGKVLVCHKPGKKKGGHTLSISRSALPAHLGHGDYEGACR